MKYTITTPIYYVNDVPHIGHAYTSVIADVLSRFAVIYGHQSLFMTGTDEHGQKVESAAKSQSVTPSDFTDLISAKFRNLTHKINLSNHDFIRTTENRHKISAQELWLKIQHDIYVSKYSGWYSLRDESFYDESEISEGLAPTGAPVEWVEEECYFFKLSKWEKPLLEFYDKNTDFITPKSRANEVISFIKNGLKDLAISRTKCKWGIPVPGDDRHVMYVWIDALSNYLTGVGFPNNNFLKSWNNVIHVIGKDILRFHAIYWPALLMSADIPLPKSLVVHGWWTNNKQKISKSIGNTIDPNQIIEQYGLDTLRYFMMRAMSLGSDGDFSVNLMLEKYNSELANNIGNMIQRVLVIIQKKCDGYLQEAIVEEEKIYKLSMHTLKESYVLIQNKNIHQTTNLILELSSAANAYIDNIKLWSLDEESIQKPIVSLTYCIYVIGVLLQPIVPQSANIILDLLAIPLEFRFANNINLGNKRKLPYPKPIFTKKSI